MGLEEAKFADALRGDAGGSEVGDAAGGEFDSDVGDIGLLRQDGEAHGVDLRDRRLCQVENDVEVMDHEIEDYVRVEGARGEDGEAVRLEEHGTSQKRGKGLHGRVEALKMTDHEGALVCFGKGYEGVGFGQCCGYGFFYEDVDAGLQKLRGYSVMGGSGNADVGSIDVEVACCDGGQQGFYRGEDCRRFGGG